MKSIEHTKIWKKLVWNLRGSHKITLTLFLLSYALLAFSGSAQTITLMRKEQRLKN